MKANKGFTVIEMLIVIAILIIITALITPILKHHDIINVAPMHKVN
jgi:prepilin-type N-terminal cleavage/methylation domain-containing protein